MRRKQIEIGSGNASGDGGANIMMNTMVSLPHVANFGAEAKQLLTTKKQMPPSSIQSGGHGMRVNQHQSAASETGATKQMITNDQLLPSQSFGAEATDLMDTTPVVPLAPIQSGGQAILDNQVIHAASEMGASGRINTIGKMPPSQSFGAEAKIRVSTIGRLPLSPIQSGGQGTYEYQEVNAASETGATLSLNTTLGMPPSQTIADLIDLQRKRRFSIKSISRCDRSCEAFIAQMIGYSSPKEKDTDRSGEKERKALFARAAAMRKAVEASMKPKKSRRKEGQVDRADQSRFALSVDGEDPKVLSACAPIIIMSATSRAAWDNLKDSATEQMEELAKSLPAYGWAATVPGFAALGLAVVIAETGDLSNYATKDRVWKRLGLAPYKGRACSSWASATPGLTAPEWIEAGYSRVRRGTIAGDVGAPLFFAKSKNAYGKVYADRRTHTAITHPDWSKGHSDNDARRIMTKALIKDLWRVWNKA